MVQETILNNSTLVCFVIGLVVGFAVRVILSHPAVGNREAFRDAVYDWGTLVALRILLPIHVFLTTAMISHDKLFKLAAMPVFGVAVCLLVYMCSRLLQLFSRVGMTYPHSPYLATTFGGGNRGIMMIFAIVAFAPAGVPKEDLMTLIDSFALLDTGYFLFFLIVIRPLLALDVHAIRSDEKESKNSLMWEVVPIVACGVIGACFNFIGKEALERTFGSETLRDTLQLAREWCSYAMATVAMSMISLVINLDLKLRTLRNLFVTIFLARLLGFSILLAILVATMVTFGIALTVFHPILHIPLAVLFICPPSSLADKMMRQDGANIETVRLAATLSGTWNICFFVIAYVVLGFSFLN